MVYVYIYSFNKLSVTSILCWPWTACYCITSVEGAHHESLILIHFQVFYHSTTNYIHLIRHLWICMAGFARMWLLICLITESGTFLSNWHVPVGDQTETSTRKLLQRCSTPVALGDKVSPPRHLLKPTLDGLLVPVSIFSVFVSFHWHIKTSLWNLDFIKNQSKVAWQEDSHLLQLNLADSLRH